MRVDNNYFIDKNTCAVYAEHPNVFVCDKEIAYSVANLNMLGYQTKASCEGHYQGGCAEHLNAPIQKLEEIKKDSTCIIRNIREDSFDYWFEITHTNIYILFKHPYTFPFMPEGFQYKINVENSFYYLEHDVNYYTSNGRRKGIEEIEMELKKYREVLYNWTKSLSEERERGR